MPLTLPSSVQDYQEILNDQRKFGEWIREGRTSELLDGYNRITQPELGEQIAQHLTAFFDGQDIIENKVKTVLTDALKEHGVNRPLMAIPTEMLARKQGAAYNPSAPGVAMNDVGFANMGDFMRVIMQKGRPDDRFNEALRVMNDYSSIDPSLGGTLIPETFRSDIYDTVLEMSVVRPRASVITLTTPSQSIPYVDQTTHVGSVFGGMSFSRVQEAGTVAATQAKFGRVRLSATKLMGTASVPNELWNDAPALSSWLMNALPRGIAFFEDIDFITGQGGDEPLGVQNSGATITITAETNQTASTIWVENIAKIYARVLPQSLGSAVWLANPTCVQQLMQLSISVGTGGAPVFLMDWRSGPTPTLLGRPIVFTEKVPALGSAGCIGLYDFGFYLIGDRQSASVEASTQSSFLSDATDIKVIVRNDGRPWIQSAITPVNGDTLSPFVMLGAVA